MDSRVRDAKDVLADLAALGKGRCRLAVVGSHKLSPSETAHALHEQWSSIVELVGFLPKRLITGCAPCGAEKATRLAARFVTGKRAAVFHRPTMVNSAKSAEMFMNILLARSCDAALILAAGTKPACVNLRLQVVDLGKKFYQVEVG